MIKFIIIYFLTQNYVFGGLLQDESEPTKGLKTEIDVILNQLEKFNAFYVTTFEQKLTTLQTTVTTIDTDLKALHEKAHVWEIFRHHIDSWTDHLKSVDHKIDLIKRTQDENNSIENKLNSLEFVLNHVLSKVDNLNEKQHDAEPKIQQKLIDIYKIVYNRERADGYEKKEMLLKLTAIMRHVLSIENNNCRPSRNIKPMESLTSTNNNNSFNFNQILREIQTKLNNLNDKMNSKDIKQLNSIGKKNTQHIENIVELVRSVDERTMRLYDAEASHSTKALDCCQSISNEIATFASSADLLLKRIEQLMVIVQEKVENVTPQPKSKSVPTDEELSSEKESSEFDLELDEKTPKENIPTQTNKTNDEENTDIDSGEVIEPDFIQQGKSGCHQITNRINGVYKFAEPDINDSGRNFNERYCTFPTDGLGWTIIQQRGLDTQENFNRTWLDYKNGFGELNKDFWLGNEFIHRLVTKDNYELRIELEDFDGIQVWAEYSIFQIDSEEENYNLMIGGYQGAVPDSLLYHHNKDFSTYDRKNDKSGYEFLPCAVSYGSGWWYDNCTESNLNGIYRDTPKGHNYVGIIWEHWHGDYSLKKSRMLIRPVDVWLKEEDASDVFPEVPEDP